MLERSKTEENPAYESCEYQPQNDNEWEGPASGNLHHFILVLQLGGGEGEEEEEERRKRRQRRISICMILPLDLIEFCYKNTERSGSWTFSSKHEQCLFLLFKALIY